MGCTKRSAALRCYAMRCDAKCDAVVCYKGIKTHPVSSLCVRCLLCCRRVKSKKGWDLVVVVVVVVSSGSKNERCVDVARDSAVVSTMRSRLLYGRVGLGGNGGRGMGHGRTGCRQKDDVDGTLAPGSRWAGCYMVQ